jgi:glycosyltransferase involved in cell wall biosynthesis
MKILLCSEYFYPKIGGVERHTQIIADYFINKNHHVEIATSSIKLNKNYRVSIKPYIINYFNISGNFIKGYNGETYNYQEFLTKSKFDIIFFNAAQQWTFDLALPIVSLIKSKKILFPCGFSRINNLLYYPYFLLLKKKINYFDTIICVNKNLEDYKFIKEHFKKKIFLINNGASKTRTFTNLENFKNKYKISKNEKIITNISNFKFYKGQDRAISIFRKLKNKDLVLVLIGKNHNSIFVLYINFMKFFLKFFYNKKVIIFLNINYKQSQKILNISDIFLFTSRLEYDPLVIYEAIIAKKKIISYNVGNTENILKNNKNCFITNDKELIVKNFDKILFRKFYYFNFKKFLWKNIMKKYYNIFLKV